MKNWSLFLQLLLVAVIPCGVLSQGRGGGGGDGRGPAQVHEHNIGVTNI